MKDITEEMIEAGYKILSESGITDCPWGVDKLLVTEIYQAMKAKELETIYIGDEYYELVWGNNPGKTYKFYKKAT